ncbi:hypothetical protein LPJ53_001325 [Coemansia erecta]|uniref:Rho-GAP domain-containing protein n=1 Tax=Coemansia erecta TaxID=147472 RepID=A0A9W7Y6Q8_9FUNG|nr:hypothetical protein LPJ53_001325 [Coemansia erecta]
MKAEHAINMPKSPSHAARANIGESQRYSGDINPDTLVYGVPLEPLMNTADGLRVLPRPIRECIAFINHHGLATEGLFRRSPPSTALRSAKDGYNRGQSVDLALAGVHVAAVLLKLFFRELPEPVFSSSNYDIVRALPASISSSPDDTSSTDVAKQMDAVRARYVEEVILPSLRPEYRLLLCFVCALLHMVARNESANRMTAYSLAIVWAPNLARSSNPVLDVTMCGAGPGAATVGSVVQIMVQMFDRVFSQELRLILANFGGSSGGQETTAGIDQADEVLRIVDRMNRGEYRGVHVAAATPPKLPPRRVASPEAAAASSPAARPTPPLPPRRSVAEDQKADEGNRSDNDDEGDDDDGDTQMFADAESDSPAAKDPTKNEARAANKSPSVESSSLAESSLVEPSLAESAHSKNNDVQEASTAAPADAETETETEAKQQL